MDSDNSDSSLSSSDTSVPRKRIVKEKKIKKEDEPYNKEKKAKKIENKDESYNKEEQYNETAETPANDETKKGSIEQKKIFQDQANPNDTEELNSEGKYYQLFEKADETLKKLESNVKITENSLTCVKRQRDKNSTKDKSKKSQKEMLTSTP